jgi:hypothetical protein
MKEVIKQVSQDFHSVDKIIFRGELLFGIQNDGMFRLLYWVISQL